MAGTEELTPPKYVDFAEYIIFQIRRTQTLIRQIDVMLLLSTAAAALLLTSLLFVLLDHWGFAQGLPSVLRWLGCLGILACVVVPAVYFLRSVSGRSISSLFAARTLERADSGFANNLMTLVDLDYHARPASAAIRGSLEKRAALTLNDLDVEHAIDRTKLLHRLYVLLAAIILFFGYSFLSPKSSVASLQRILFPWTTAVAPTQTRILEVQPGSGQVTAGSHVEVSAYIDGKAPEKVWLIYSTEDRRIVDERIELHQTDEGLGRYIGVITGENGRGVDQTTTYHLQAGDGRSPTYMLSVKPAPRAAIESVMIEPPAYTKRQPYRQPGGAIDGLEGSRVRLEAQTNIPVTKAWIQLYSSEDPGDRSGQLPLTVSESTKLRGEWTLKIQDDGTYPRFYSIQCESEDGANDPAPPLHAILIRPDERPEVRLLSPVSDLSRPINVALPLMIEAFDPDFELSGLSVQVEKQGQIVSSELIDAAGKQAIRTTHTLDLERLPVSPGETVSFWVEARDNRLPHPNRRSTPKLRLQILDPIDPAQAEKQTEEEQKKAEEAFEKGADPATSEEMKPDDPSTEDMPEEGDTEDKQNQTEGAEGDQNTESQQPAEDSKTGKGEQSKKSENGKQGDKGEQEQGEKSEEGTKSEDPTFSPEGEDDDLVLEKLIERMKEKEQENQPQDPNQPKKPGDNPSESPESKKDPDGQNMPEKNGESDPNAKPDQPGDTPADSRPNTDKPSPDQPADPKGYSPTPSENQPDGDPAESMPKNGEKPGDTAEEGMKPGQEGSEEDTPGETMTPAEDPSQNPTGTQPNPNSDATNKQPGTEEGEKRPATPEEEMNGEKQPAQEPGKGESKPGEGNEEGPMERDPNGDPKSPPAQKPPGQVDAPPDQMQPPAADPNQPTSPENQPPSDQNPQPGKNQPSNSQDGKSQPNQDSQNPDSKPSGQSPSDPSMKPAGEQKGTPQQSPNNQDPQTGKPSDTPADGKPGEQMPTNPSDSKTPGNSPTDQNSDSKPSDGKPSDGMPADGEPPKDQPQNGKQPDGNPPDSPKSDGNKNSDSQQPQNGKQSQDGKGQSGEGNKPSPGGGKPGQSSPPMEDGPRGKGSPQPGGESNGRTAAPDPEGDVGPGGVGEGDAKQTSRPGDSGSEGTGPSSSPSAESLEDRRKAAELVLKELEEDLKRGEVDPELLEELNWTEDNLKKFQQRMADYLRQQNDENTPDLKQQQFNEMLRNLRLDGQRNAREGAATDRESRDEFAPTIMPAPPEYRELEEAFRRSLSGADQAN